MQKIDSYIAIIRRLKKVISIIIVLNISSFLIFGGENNNNLTLQQTNVASPTQIVVNPYANINISTTPKYKANLHSHTTNSDGFIYGNSIVYNYHRKDYKILAITDHNVITWPWTKFDSIDSRWKNQNPKALEMLAIKGNELSANHHWNSLINVVDGDGANIIESFNTMRAINGIGFINHPGRYWKINTDYKPEQQYSLEYYMNFYNLYPELLALEVYNANDSYPNDRILWDELLTQMMPQRPVWGISNDDIHYQQDYYKNYSFFFMDDFTIENFKESFTKGEFFFHWEPNGDGDPKTPIINNIIIDTENNTITIDASNYNSIEWISGVEETLANRVSKQVGAGAEFYYGSFMQPYVRVVLTNEHGTTNTQPFGFAPSFIAFINKIDGDTKFCEQIKTATFSIDQDPLATSYHWTIPLDAEIIEGENSHQITINIENLSDTNEISVYKSNPEGNSNTASLWFEILITEQTNINETICAGESFMFENETYTQAGTYTVWGTGVNECPAKTVINIDVFVVDDSITSDGVTISANNNEAQYQWVNCDDDNSFIDGATSKDFTPDISGNYAVIVYQNNCEAISQCIKITKPRPSQIEVIDGDTKFCEQIKTATFSIDQDPLATSYHWTIPLDTEIIEGENSHQITINIENLSDTNEISVYKSNPEGNSNTASLWFEILITEQTNINETICAGESFMFENETYTQAGTYTVWGTGVNECPAKTVINIDVFVVDDSITSDGVAISANNNEAQYQWVNCDDDNSFIDGATSKDFTPDISGNYAVILYQNNCEAISQCIKITKPRPSQIEDIDGDTKFCEQIKTATFSIDQDPLATSYHWTIPLDAEIIEGENSHQITINIENLSDTNEISVYKSNPEGNSNTASLWFEILITEQTNINETICAGESFMFENETYTQAGTYTVWGTGVNECPAKTVINIDVFVVDDSITSDGVTISANNNEAQYQWVNCDDDNSFIDGATSKDFTPDISGNYAVIVYQNNCEAISQCIKITKPRPSQIEVIDGDTKFCEQIKTATFSIDQDPLATSYHWTIPLDTEIIEGENSHQITINIENLSDTNEISVYKSNPEGNSNTASLWFENLITEQTNINETICAGESFTFENETYTQAGTYTVWGTGVNECPAKTVINIDVKEIDTEIYQEGFTLLAQETDAIYQWVNCNNNFEEINGANDRTFIAPRAGIYAVIISKGKCSATSDCTPVIMVDITHNEHIANILVYPNPAQNYLTLVSNINTTINMIDAFGRIYLTQQIYIGDNFLNLSHLKPGVYFIQIRDKIIKIAKQ
jgi:intein-encoded DNA endonuclease-like protein